MEFPTQEPGSVPAELKFSHSRLSTYDSCWRKAGYIYHEGFRRNYDSPALTFGRILHRILELHYKGICSPMEAYPLYLNKEFPTFVEQKDIFAAVALGTRYVSYYKNKDNFRILGVEKDLIVPYSTPNGVTVYLHVILDLIAEHQGQLAVIDHKSSARNVWSNDMILFDPQIALYMCALMLMDYEPNIGVINQISTASKDTTKIANAPGDKLFSRFTVQPSPRILEGWLREFGQKIDRILEAEIFPRTLTNNCRNCPYREACSMELQGIDSKPYLETNFPKTPHTTYEIDVELEDYPN